LLGNFLMHCIALLCGIPKSDSACCDTCYHNVI